MAPTVIRGASGASSMPNSRRFPCCRQLGGCYQGSHSTGIRSVKGEAQPCRPVTHASCSFPDGDGASVVSRNWLDSGAGHRRSWPACSRAPQTTKNDRLRHVAGPRDRPSFLVACLFPATQTTKNDRLRHMHNVPSIPGYFSSWFFDEWAIFGAI